MTRVKLARRALAVATTVCALGAVFALLGIASLSSRASTPSGSSSSGVSELVRSRPATAQSAPRIVVDRGTVMNVVDAVSFDVRLEGGGWARVRALGVQSPGACYDAASVAFARGVLEGKSVALVSDTRFPSTDRFDRRLAHAVVGPGDYAVLAAEAGVARSYSAGTTSERTQPVREAQERARAAARGLWGPPCDGAE